MLRKGQADWQVKQSLDAIGLLMLHGYQREGLRIPELREAWGLRLNERLGISVGDLKSRATAKASSREGAAGTEIPIKGVTDRLRRVLRVAHYAIKTEKAYTQWWERFEQFSRVRNAELGTNDAEHASRGATSPTLVPDDVRSFLEHLAVERKVSAATQKQALNALVFVFGQVLGRPLGSLGDWTIAKETRRLPCVLTVAEVPRVLRHLKGVPAFVAQLLYGSGLRLSEALRLRVKDVEFEAGQIIVRDGKGEKDRVTMLPQSVRESLLEHLRGVWRLHQQDLKAGMGNVALPYALAVKYPKAERAGVSDVTSLARGMGKRPDGSFSRYFRQSVSRSGGT